MIDEVVELDVHEQDGVGTSVSQHIASGRTNQSMAGAGVKRLAAVSDGLR